MVGRMPTSAGWWIGGAMTWLAAVCIVVGCGRKSNTAPPPMDWVLVPAGAFVMGSAAGEPAELPTHRVTLRAFRMARTETTVAQYRTCVRAGVCSKPDTTGELCSGRHEAKNSWLIKGGDNLPINCVDWSQSKAFCRWLGAALPTEAQWERAARAGGQDERHGPLDSIAWHGGNAGERVHAVATRQANALGLHDMIGNVWEWTADFYAADWYARSPTVDPKGPSTGDRRVSRGGGIHMKSKVLRSAYRHDERPDERFYFLGFRCATTPVAPAK